MLPAVRFSSATSPQCRPSCTAGCHARNRSAKCSHFRPLRPRLPGQRGRGHGCIVAASSAAAATDDKPPVQERLSGDDAERWSASIKEVTQLGYDDDEAAAMLETAFGWRGQKFWRGLKKEEVAAPEDVAATLRFMREEIGMSEQDIQAALKKFPEALASGVEERLKPNMEKMEKEMYMKLPKVRLKAIKRQPKALGFSYDCEGSCEGECHRCWVRF